ncbi:MAG: lipopolysaccharide assembly protein LapB [Wenzhouxiangellaceae bacterium]|nr:lipopolysaccharide assembly protein LapB [Wenzhouxiangellaceae bacterium]
MPEYVWLLLALLPLAAWSGWRAAAHYYQRGEKRQQDSISSNYFRGLNYLLNEQPDKAIEVFLELAEINQETVETHLALGNLFRRRGEVDKAIGFHRHIMTRSNLGEQHRTQALLELGEDYMRAGLLDRAEKLFSDLAESDPRCEAAIRSLLSIYQQEKDWQRAIAQARTLGDIADTDCSALIAQFYCELAARAQSKADLVTCRENLAHARSYQAECVRVLLIESELLISERNWAEAAKACQDACEIDPDIAVLVVDTLKRCFEESGTREALLQWLKELAGRASTTAPVRTFATLRARTDPGQAIGYLLNQLQQRPSVRDLHHLLELMHDHGHGLDKIDPRVLRQLMSRLLHDQARFRCQHCGFSGQTWHWQCPSCREWESTRPIQGVLGE